MDPFETFEHEGMTVELHYDECDDGHADPREFDNLGLMLCTYPGYDLGDERMPEDLTIDCPDCDGTGFQPTNGAADCAACEGYGSREVGILDYLKATYKPTVILPLFVYEHSGITIKAGANLLTAKDPRTEVRSSGRFVGDGAGWDTSFVGVILDTEDSRKLTGAPLDSIERQLDGEVEEYAMYLEGQVYGYIVKYPGGEEADSCWGFLGDEYVRESAKEAADCYTTELESRREACLVRGDN